MVEIALALLVLALGILAVFSLMGRGMDRSAEAAADTQVALFADSVLSGLRAQSVAAAETGTNGWESFWADFASGQTNLTVAGGDLWVGSDMAIEAGVLRTNVYINDGLRTNTVMEIANHAVRYRLDVALLTNTCSQGVWMNGAAVTLVVWPGEFGGETNVFYTEYDRQGEL